MVVSRTLWRMVAHLESLSHSRKSASGRPYRLEPAHKSLPIRADVGQHLGHPDCIGSTRRGKYNRHLDVLRDVLEVCPRDRIEVWVDSRPDFLGATCETVEDRRAVLEQPGTRKVC